MLREAHQKEYGSQYNEFALMIYDTAEDQLQVDRAANPARNGGKETRGARGDFGHRSLNHPYGAELQLE